MGRRTVTPVEQTQAVVSEAISSLRKSFPEWAKLGISCEYEFEIHIRDGLIQSLDLEASQDVETPSAEPAEQDIESLIRKVEVWLLKCLPSRLISGYHGRVKVLVALVSGNLKFVPTIRQQRRFDWSNCAT